MKYSSSIAPNILSKGLKIFHLGNVVINGNASIGEFCILKQGVVVGQSGLPLNVPKIGDCVNLCPGAKVIGKCIIGNNVVIVPNAVITKDMHPNVVVGGVNKIIKYRKL